MVQKANHDLVPTYHIRSLALLGPLVLYLHSVSFSQIRHTLLSLHTFACTSRNVNFLVLDPTDSYIPLKTQTKCYFCENLLDLHLVTVSQSLP